MDEVVVEEEYYSPLRDGEKSLQNLDALLPLFSELDEQLRILCYALGNGRVMWRPPLKKNAKSEKDNGT